MAEKLKLATNVPQDIALKFSEGKPYSSEYGDSVMYTLTDERIWFAPPIVAQKITQLGITRGELFRIVKAEVTKGNRRTVEYQVSRITAEPPASPRLAPWDSRAVRWLPSLCKRQHQYHAGGKRQSTSCAARSRCRSTDWSLPATTAKLQGST